MKNYDKNKECHPNKKRKILIVPDDMIADMLSNKNPNPIAAELFIRSRKLNFSCFYCTILFCCCYFRLNSTHYFIMKIQNKR